MATSHMRGILPAVVLNETLAAAKEFSQISQLGQDMGACLASSITEKEIYCLKEAANNYLIDWGSIGESSLYKNDHSRI